jgi:hypothetical protein
VQPVGQKREVAFRRNREDRQHVVVERASHREVERNRRGHRNGRGEGRHRQARGQHARYGNDQQHQEHEQRVRNHVEAGRVDQDVGPRQAEQQVEKDEACAPAAGSRRRHRFMHEAAAIGDQQAVNGQNGAGPEHRGERFDPEAGQQACNHHQQDDDQRGG